LAPNQSEELELPDDLDLTNLQQSLGWFKSEVGGITLTHHGPKGALNASGWIEDEQLSFSTMMNFFDPAVTHGRNLFATQMLMGEVSEALGLSEKMKVESHLVLRNLTGQNVAALGQFFYTEGEGVQPLNPGRCGSIGVSSTRPSARAYTKMMRNFTPVAWMMLRVLIPADVQKSTDFR
jgi:hypothetical protein